MPSPCCRPPDVLFEDVGDFGVEVCLASSISLVCVPAACQGSPVLLIMQGRQIEYLKKHFDEKVSLPKIYCYLDKLSNSQHERVQDMLLRHTRQVLEG